MADCNYIHYSLQLNIYDRMVALRGLTCLGRILIHITHEEYDETETDIRCKGKYKVKFFNIENLQEEVTSLFKHHKRSMLLTEEQYTLF